MTPERLTQADEATLAALSDLCLRSKAHWGYDAVFMAACRDVLSVTQDDLCDPVAVVRDGSAFAGLVRLDLASDTPELSKLFVCPAYMRQGIGSALITWAKKQAAQFGHTSLRIESDPEAVPFYQSHGAVIVGQAPSEAIPDRFLPVLNLPTHRP